MNGKFLKNVKKVGVGVLIGAVNGMLGAGGGMIAVPMLSRAGLEKKAAHSNAVAIILPITVISAVLYVMRGHVALSDAWGFIPTGVIGSVIGTAILKRISPLWLKRIFGGFMLYAGVRLLIK